ncbi:MAG: hypothetical protein LKJ25_03505 [Clostridia bacterium]|nr:hypothetical protein [Clostridia bacterium]
MENKRDILMSTAKVIKHNDFDVVVFNGDDTHPDVLRVNIGKKLNLENDIPIEMYFIKSKTPREEKQLFQFYAVLKTDFKEDRKDEVNKTIMMLNNLLPVGQFNTFGGNKHIFMRDSILIDLTEEMNKTVMDICDYFSMIAAAIKNVGEYVTDVADAYADFEDIKYKLKM